MHSDATFLLKISSEGFGHLLRLFLICWIRQTISWTFWCPFPTKMTHMFPKLSSGSPSFTTLSSHLLFALGRWYNSLSFFICLAQIYGLCSEDYRVSLLQLLEKIAQNCIHSVYAYHYTEGRTPLLNQLDAKTAGNKYLLHIVRTEGSWKYKFA